jgi:hypothetical protein
MKPPDSIAPFSVSEDLSRYAQQISATGVFRQAGCLIDFIVGYREIVYRVFRYGIWHS